MNEGMYSKDLLLVMDELRDRPYFNLENQILVYKIPREGQKFNGRKVIGIQNLLKLGGARIHYKTEQKLVHYSRVYYGGKKVIEYDLKKATSNIKVYGLNPKIEYIFPLLIKHTAFDRILRSTVWKVKGQSLDEYDSQRQNQKNLSLLRKKLSERKKTLNKVIKQIKLMRKSMEWILLEELSDFQQHDTTHLKEATKSKSINSLRVVLNKKLEGTGLEIKWKRSEELFNRKGVIWWLDHDVRKIKSNKNNLGSNIKF